MAERVFCAQWAHFALAQGLLHMQSTFTQQLGNGIRLTSRTPLAPAPAPKASLAQFQRAPLAPSTPVDPHVLEQYRFALEAVGAPGSALEPWHAVVLRDRVTKRGEVVLYLIDGDWRTEVPSRVIERVLDGRPTLVVLEAFQQPSRTVRLHWVGA